MDLVPCIYLSVMVLSLQNVIDFAKFKAPPSYDYGCLQVYETKGTLYLVTGSNDKNVNVYSVGVSHF